MSPAGRTVDAIPLHEQAVAALERVLGPAHPDTLSSRNNLALAYQEAGRAVEAGPPQDLALVTIERTRGRPGTLSSRSNLPNTSPITGLGCPDSAAAVSTGR